MLTLAVVNHKGGVGKTTAAAHLAAGGTRNGLKVLAVDMDPQANLSQTLTHEDIHLVKHNIVSILEKDYVDDNRPWIEAFEKDLWLLPSHIDLDQTAMELQAKPYCSPLLLRDRLSKLATADIDLCVIDCPPSLGLLTANALTAADFYIVPIESGSRYSLAGLAGLETLIRNLRPLNPKLELLGLVLMMHDGRRVECKRSIDAITRRFGHEKLFQAHISNVRAQFQDCEARHISVYARDHKAVSAIDFYRLTREVLMRMNLRSSIPQDPEIAETEEVVHAAETTTE
jgi:chromosome partitioning protein